MAKRKQTFPEPGCYSCPHHTVLGNGIFGTRVCMGVKSKKGKRFRSSDPHYKPPKWCPKRLPVRICRISRPANEMYASMECDTRISHEAEKLEYYSLHTYRYDPVPRRKFATGISARELYERAKKELTEAILDEADLRVGDVIEIDDGLRPYYFYYYSSGCLLPTSSLESIRRL